MLKLTISSGESLEIRQEYGMKKKMLDSVKGLDQWGLCWA